MKRLMIFLFMLMLVAVGFCAEEPQQKVAVSSSELDVVIDDVISRPEYTWRSPRVKAQVEEKDDSFLALFFKQAGEYIAAAFKWIGGKLQDLVDWIESWGRDREPEFKKREPVDWRTGARVGLYILLAVAASVLGVQLYRFWRQRKRSVRINATQVVNKVPDIMSEETTADELPSDEWMNMATEFLRKGDLRSAVRAMFLACLARLAHQEHITVVKSKSNREYIRELQRRAHDMPVMIEAFEDNVNLLERVWYGMHKATQTMVTKFTANKEKIFDD